MKEQDEGQRRPFTGGSLADDLLDWAEKLKMLSTANTHAQRGEAYSSIIKDYAELIETAVNKTIGHVNGWGGSAEVRLAQLQEIDRMFAITIRPVDIESARIHGLTEVIHNICPPSFALKKNMEDLKKALMASQKNATTGLKVIAGGKCFRQSAAVAH
jgi:hypothetical protein